MTIGGNIATVTASTVKRSFFHTAFHRCAVASIFATFLVSAVSAAEVHPIEAELRRSFPTVAIESAATFEPAATLVRGTLTSGLRPRFARAAKSEIAVRAAMPRAPMPEQSMATREPVLQVLYPRSYDGLLVVELGDQRVVLRATGASGSQAVEVNGKLVYSGAYASTDAVEVPGGGRSEELLLLRDERAPRTFDYEIVETEGVAAVVLDDGAIRFLAKVTPPAMSEITAGRFTRREPSLQIDRPWLIDAAGRRSEKHAAWTLIGGGGVPKGIRLTLTAEGLAFPIVVDPSFSATGTLGAARRDQTSTLLPNGKVLIAGGWAGVVLASAELYDPASGTFSATGSLGTARYVHTATLLPNGKVLIAGGQGASSTNVTSAELYDPASGTFSATGSLATARFWLTATLLPSGKVLIVGGYNNTIGSLTSAQLYDPTSGTFSATGNLSTARARHTATLLPNGDVLIAGGYNNGTYLASAELYNPTSGTFSATGSLVTARDRHKATLLPNGKMLLAGGSDNGGELTSAELYDPTSGTFSATGSLATARIYHTATLLPGGEVLIAGGLANAGALTLTSAELYYPASGTFYATGSLATARFSPSATLLPNGKVLLAAGGNSGGELTSAELYDPTLMTFTDTGSLGTARFDHTATLLPTRNVLIAGGVNASAVLTSTELYDPLGRTFSATGGLGTARQSHTATLLPNGNVLIAGGVNAAYLTSGELYDPTSGTFSATGSLGTARRQHTATLLPNGKVLIAGGFNGAYLTSAELYDPTSGTFSTTGSLGTARRLHTATLLPNGKVLIAGGFNGAYPMSAELYDPTSGTFSATGNLITARDRFTATLLPNGKVLIAGGFNGLYLTAAELYDPASATFSATGSLGTERLYPTATLLPNGRVLIAGGQSTGVVYLTSAELYDPATGTFSAPVSLGTARRLHTATLLPNGRVLFAGGDNGISLTSAELYDAGDRFDDARRPVITSAPGSLALPATLTIIGSGFRGDSEASSGGANSSPTNYPVVKLQRIDNEQTFFVTPTSIFNDVSWAAALNAVTPGWYRITLFTNAIPAIQQLILITAPTPTITSVSPDSGLPSGGQTVTITGTNLSGVSVTIGGNLATVTGTSATSATFITPAHTPGAVDVMVTSPPGVSATASGAYMYVPLAPTNVVATATSATSVHVTWTASVGATEYYVLRSTDGVNFLAVAIVSDTSATDLSASANTAYLYAVRASAPSFSENSAPDLATTVMFTDPILVAQTTRVKAVHIAELRIAVNAVRKLATFTQRTFTDPSIVVGVTRIKALHVTELRTALNGPRSSMGLASIIYSQPTLNVNVTTIRAADINELRDGTQ